VRWLVERLCALWGPEASWQLEGGEHPHEAHYLKLDCSKVHAELGWWPRWGLEKALESIVEWTQVYRQGGNVRDICLDQIMNFYRAR